MLKERKVPSSTVWKILRIIFILTNILVTIQVILALIACVAIGAVASGKMKFEDRPLPDALVQAAQVALAVAIPMVVLESIQVTLGFFAIVKLHLTSFYIYTIFVVINLILNIIVTVVSGFFVGIIGQSLTLVLMFFLIRWLKKENNIH